MEEEELDRQFVEDFEESDEELEDFQQESSTEQEEDDEDIEEDSSPKKKKSQTKKKGNKGRPKVEIEYETEASTSRVKQKN